jgi:hypothetical protein
MLYLLVVSPVYAMVLQASPSFAATVLTVSMATSEAIETMPSIASSRQAARTGSQSKPSMDRTNRLHLGRQPLSPRRKKSPSTPAARCPHQGKPMFAGTDYGNRKVSSLALLMSRHSFCTPRSTPLVRP